MHSSRILTKARSQIHRRTEALKAIAKAVSYLTAGGYHEDATAFRAWSRTGYNRRLPNATTRVLGSNEEYWERAVLYLQAASFDLEIEGNDDTLRSFMMEVQAMAERIKARKRSERETLIEESERALEQVDSFIAKLDEGDEDALDLAVEAVEKHGSESVDDIEQEAEERVPQAAMENLERQQWLSRPM